MTKGATVKTQLFRNDKDGNLQLCRDYGPRKVSITQTNSFALETETPEGMVNSWCAWPKKNEFVPLGDNKAEIHFQGGKLIYEFV